MRKGILISICLMMISMYAFAADHPKVYTDHYKLRINEPGIGSYPTYDPTTGKRYRLEEDHQGGYRVLEYGTDNRYYIKPDGHGGFRGYGPDKRYYIKRRIGNKYKIYEVDK